MNKIRIAKRAALVLVVGLVLSQFVPIARTNPAVETIVPAPAPVEAILRRACFDCHSNETVWPWYSRVAPVSWLVARDVRHGREHVNFSTWNRLDDAKQRETAKKIWEEVSEGEMPLSIYLPMHPQASLSLDDLAMIKAWTQSLQRE